MGGAPWAGSSQLVVFEASTTDRGGRGAAWRSWQQAWGRKGEEGALCSLNSRDRSPST